MAEFLTKRLDFEILGYPIEESLTTLPSLEAISVDIPSILRYRNRHGGPYKTVVSAIKTIR